jgi:threonine synthase
VRVLQACDGVVEEATEHELADAVARADRTGLYNCPHTGVALAATEKLAARGVIAPGDRVVVVSTAHGLKFSEFKRAYHEGVLPGATSHAANVPVPLAPEVGAVRDVIARHLDARAGS